MRTKMTALTGKCISRKMLEQDDSAKKMKLEEFLNLKKFDTEKLREIIKVIRVYSQENIEIEWNFDDVFLKQR